MERPSQAHLIWGSEIMLVAMVAVLGPATAQQTLKTAPDVVERQAKLYADCMSLARSDPEKAVGIAAKWERRGGDEGARHCGAVARLNSGKYIEAAETLQSLAATTQRLDKAIKANLFAQAAQAWMISGDLERAIRAQSRALETGGPNVEILVDRAIARGGLGDYWAAIDDLNDVIDREAGHVQALILRATAWRKLKNLDLALDDIARAQAVAPSGIDALLERGNIYALRGERTKAVGDWRGVIRISPNSIAAEAARENLAKNRKQAP
jgi:tetratricopeptide (TPR) repeat protein